MSETTQAAIPVDPDFTLIDRLFTLHPPANATASELMDGVRQEYTLLATLIVQIIPRTPDRTIALRSLHRACMDTIASIACNQDLLPHD